MNIRHRLAPPCLIIMLGTSPLAVAGKDGHHHDHDHQHRHHDSHQHGVAELNIAIDGSNLMIELQSPAANIVGFEHSPRNAQQRTLIDNAVNTLEKPEQLFLISPEARCILEEAEVDSDIVKKGHDHKHDHDHDHKKESSHSEFSVGYSFKCDAIDKLQSIEVKLFSRFEGMEKIKAQLVTPGKQGLENLSPSHNKIEF